MAQSPDPLSNVSLPEYDLNVYTEKFKGPSPSDQFVESLDRLSKKTGVLATIVLDRSSGAILNTSGTLSSIRSATGSSTSVSATASEETSSEQKEQNGMQEMAVMVWNYMNSTRELVQGLDVQVSSFRTNSSNGFNLAHRMKSNYCVYEPRNTNSL
jgi:hypothetical protein